MATSKGGNRGGHRAGDASAAAGVCPAGLETYHILEVAVERLDERVDELEDRELILFREW